MQLSRSIRRAVSRAADAAKAAAEHGHPAVDRARPVLEHARAGWGLLTPVGRMTLAFGAVAWVLGARLGWRELFLVAATALIALLVAATFVLGRPLLDTRIDLDPTRVTVGTPASGRIVATNIARTRLRAMHVELPVGASHLRLDIPSLARGASHEELFIIPTHRRAVIPLGPASAVRTDPIGLLRRQAVSPETDELFVHPRIVMLDSLGAGLQRDLEGQTTKDLSTSDLAFHTLRDYVNGDDRRYVHWRSSAKAGKLLVRQFLDTRRSRLALVVDGSRDDYSTEDEFETAISVAGSIGVRAAMDEQDVVIAAAGQLSGSGSPRLILDELARAELGGYERNLPSLAQKAAQSAPDTSVAILLTGSVVPYADLRAAAVWFGPDVHVLAIRVEADAPPGITSSGGLTVLALRSLSDLPTLLTVAVAA